MSRTQSPLAVNGDGLQLNDWPRGLVKMVDHVGFS